jgi:hypothetical protein
MIPSLLNLMIAGASFIRGVPGLPTMLLRFMPAGKVVPSFDRQWLALVLTSQLFVGAFLGVAAQVLLFVVVIFHIMPWFGLGLLDATALAAPKASSNSGRPWRRSKFLGSRHSHDPVSCTVARSRVRSVAASAAARAPRAATPSQCRRLR